MRITSRRRAIATFVTLGVCLAGLAVAVGSGYVILNWRQDLKVFLGVIFFGAIAAGIVLNTTFLVREIRRNEQHDSFINAVTHELKTPITSLRLYLQTLQSREVEEKQRGEFYRLMLDDTDRLLNTVNQVLKAGQAGHKKDRHRAAVDFDVLVRGCVETARGQFHLSAEALRYLNALNGTSATLMGDAEELRTAVSNVLDNAIKYSAGAANVTVRVEAPDPEHIRVSVCDRGVGIAPPELKRIFRRFYRVPNRSHTDVKGTGLGLFIVRAITRKHKGRVFAASEGEGHGTTITMELPRSTS